MSGIFSKIAATVAAINVIEFVREFSVRILVVVLAFVFLMQIIRIIKWILESRPARFVGRTFLEVIGWLERRNKLCAQAVERIKWFGSSILKPAFNAFHTIEDGDGEIEMVRKIRANYVRGLVYGIADYWLAILCALMVSQLNDWKWSFFWIFVATWAYDILCCGISIVGCVKSNQDLTLGEAHRRAFEAVCSRSSKAGLAYKLIQHPVAVIWTGPEQLVFFYRKELDGFVKMTGVVIFLTIFQGAFWAWLYSLGHETVSGLLKSVF